VSTGPGVRASARRSRYPFVAGRLGKAVYERHGVDHLDRARNVADNQPVMTTCPGNARPSTSAHLEQIDHLGDVGIEPGT
jgi:hypothetical protein